MIPKYSTHTTESKQIYMGEIQPGIKFFYALCNVSKPISRYNLKIPETYCPDEGKLLVYNENKQRLIEVENVSITMYKTRLEIEAMRHINNLLDPAYQLLTNDPQSCQAISVMLNI